MRNFIIMLLVAGSIITGCKSSYFKKAAKSYVLNGYISSDYVFSDAGTRNLRIKFLSDSTLKISNRVTSEHAPSHYLYNFDAIYTYTSLAMGVMKIKEPIDGSHALIKGNYVKPYSRGALVSQESIFPDITGDTIYLSPYLEKIQIREFSFDALCKLGML